MMDLGALAATFADRRRAAGLAATSAQAEPTATPVAPAVQVAADRVSHWTQNTPARERDLIARYKAGDRVAGNALIAQYRFFITGRARKFGRRGFHNLTEDDLFQEGALGVLRAAEMFDFACGNRFLTYAGHWVDHKIRRAIDNAGEIRVPAHRLVTWRRARAGRAEYTDADVRTDQVLRTAPIDRPAHDDQEVTLGELLASDAPDPESLLANEQRAALRESLVCGALDVLDGRQKFVVRRRFLTDAPLTLEEIGDLLGMGREHVRQVEEKALMRLRRALRAKRGAAIEGLSE